MYLSDLVKAIKFEIGEALDADEDGDIDPQLMLRINGIVTRVDDVEVNRHEITLSPRTV